MLYDTARCPPPVGSPLEWVFLVVCRMREERNFLRDRAVWLAELGACEAGSPAAKLSVEMFEAYRQLLFPESKKEEKKASAEDRKQKILDAWMGFGPIPLTPLQPVKLRRRS